jgi:hypothetical protein
MKMESSNGLAGHAARLLGAGPADAPARRNDALVVLADQVAVALGVARQAGERTLFAQDNLPLRLLLEERRQLGVEAAPDAVDAALRRGSLILAARGAAGPGGIPARGLSVLLGPGDGSPVCAFTHEATLRRFAGSAPITAWVTECSRVWQFAVHIARREVVVDPGAASELHVGNSRLQRLLA